MATRLAFRAMAKKPPEKTRRTFTDEDKRRILAEAAATSSGAVIAKYGIGYNAISTWRKKLGKAPTPAAAETTPQRTATVKAPFEDAIRDVVREEMARLVTFARILLEQVLREGRQNKE